MFLQKVLLFAGDKRLDSVSWNGFYFSIFNMVSCSFLWKWQPEFSCSYRNTGIYPIFLYSMSLGIFSLLFTELYLFFFPMTMWNAYSFKQCYEILITDNSNLIAFTHLLKMLEKIQCKVHFLKTIPFTSCLNIIFLEDISILFEFPVYREIYAILSVRIHNRLQTSRKK